MRPDWNVILTISVALGLFTLVMLYVRHELRRYPFAPKETGPLPSPQDPKPLRRVVALPLGPQRTARRSTRMKIYLVTVADQAAINAIDSAIELDEPLFIGDRTQHGLIAEIQEYLNVDS